MTTRHSTGDRRNERGSALLGVVLLLMMMSALAAALGVSGHTETVVARNHRSVAQAQAAADTAAPKPKVPKAREKHWTR